MKCSDLSRKYAKKRCSCENIAKVSDYLYKCTELSEWHYLSEKLRNCGTMLSFAVDPDDVDYRNLVDANFCRHRMCPMCGWRRSLRVYSNVKSMFEVLLDKEKLQRYGFDSYVKYNFRFVFVTLTVPNCRGENLSLVLDDMLKSFSQYFMRCKDIKKVCLGYYRTLEVTYNQREDSFHPHIHCIFAVSSDYFDSSSGKYLSTYDIKCFWKRACGMHELPTKDNLPICNIKAIYDKSGKSGDVERSVDVSSVLAEVSKYCCKSKDYEDVSNMPQSAYVLETLSDALRGRRLIGYGGIFKRLRSTLKQDDENLLDLSEEELREASEQVVVSVFWHAGFSQYKIFGFTSLSRVKKEKESQKDVSSDAIKSSAWKQGCRGMGYWSPEFVGVSPPLPSSGEVKKALDVPDRRKSIFFV